MHLIFLSLILMVSYASSEIAPWLAEPYTTSNQGYQSGQGGQGYNNGGQGYQQVAFHAQRASPYSRKGSPITFERSDKVSTKIWCFLDNRDNCQFQRFRDSCSGLWQTLVAVGAGVGQSSPVHLQVNTFDTFTFHMTTTDICHKL